MFPSGACVQVRPFGAILPTAARRAPSREAADGYTCPQAPDGSPTGKHVIPEPGSCHRVTSQAHMHGHMAWTGADEFPETNQGEP